MGASQTRFGMTTERTSSGVKRETDTNQACHAPIGEMQLFHGDRHPTQTCANNG